MYVGVALVWLVLLVKVPAVLRGWRDRGRRTYWLAIFCLMVCLTVDRTPIYWATSRFTGIPNLAHGISYGAAIVGGFLAQLFLLYSYDRRRLDRELPWRRVFLGVGLVLYAALFVAGPAQLPTDPDVPHVAATGPGLAAFRLVLAAMVCWSMAEISWLAWRFSALSAQASLRRGMRVVSLGCALVAVRVGIEYGVFPLWSAASGWTESWSYSGALYGLNLVAMGGAALMALGTALPALSRRREGLRASARHREECRTLLPLWEQLRSVTPALSNVRGAAPRRGAGRWAPLDGLYRMVAEIRDGYVALWPYRDLVVEQDLRRRGAAAGLRDLDLDAYVEAGSLRGAMDARATSQLAAQPISPPSLTGGSFDAEVDYLLRVARWWETPDAGAALADRTESGTSARP
ncbi:MAB_1171c family putative transporter [Vallicoccus soli]